MFFRGQKGSPVKFEFDIFVENIKPWTSAQAQSDGAPIPLLLAWRRGRSRSGTTKTAMPSVGGADGGKVVFNESFILPVTLFEGKSGEFQKKSLTFALLEDENAKVVKISRQLAIGELDLSHFGNAAEPQSTSIPLAIGLAGTHAEGDPTLFLRVSSSGRLPSSSSIFARRPSSGGRSSVTGGNPHRTSYLLPPARSSYGQTPASSSSAKATGEAMKNKVETPKLSEEEMRERLLGLPEPPRKAAAARAKTLAAAKKSMDEAGALAEKNIDSLRNSSTGKNLEAVAASAGNSLEAVRNAAPRKNLEAVAVSAATKTTEVATSAVKAVEALGKSVLSTATKASAELGISAAAAAAAAYGAKKVSKDDRPSESRASELPPHKSSSPPDTESSVVVTSFSPQQSAANAKADTEKRGPEADDQNRSVLGDARAKMAMVEKRAIEELRSKVAAAEAKAVAYEEKGKEIARRLKEKMLKQEDELRDTAAIEVALYSVTAEHTSSAHKVHTPARRLARLYVYAFKKWSLERRASCARNSIQGLVVAVRALKRDCRNMQVDILVVEYRRPQRVDHAGLQCGACT